MTHSLSTFDADSPPAMYRSATLAMVVSSTSMKVGMTTAMATNQGLIAGRLRAPGARVTLHTRGLLGNEPGWSRILDAASVSTFMGRGGPGERVRWVARRPGRWARWGLGEAGKVVA